MKKSQLVKIRPKEGRKNPDKSQSLADRLAVGIGASLASLSFFTVLGVIASFPLAALVRLVSWLVSNVGVGAVLTWLQSWSVGALLTIPAVAYFSYKLTVKRVNEN